MYNKKVKLIDNIPDNVKSNPEQKERKNARQLPIPQEEKKTVFIRPEGQPRKYGPQELFDKALEYFTFCANNPLYEMRPFGTGYCAYVPHMRAMSLAGFFTFANMVDQTWHNYAEKPEYIDVITRVRNMLFNQKFEGAACELLNPNIIARDLGLTDKQEINVGNITINIGLPGNSPVDNNQLTTGKVLNIDSIQTEQPKLNSSE